MEREDSPGRREQEKGFCQWMEGDFNLAFEKLCVWCAEGVCVCACWCVWGEGALWLGASPLCMTKVRLRVDGWALSVTRGKGEGV